MIFEWFIRASAALFWLLVFVAAYRVVRGKRVRGTTEKIRFDENVTAVIKRPGRTRTIK